MLCVTSAWETRGHNFKCISLKSIEFLAGDQIDLNLSH